MNIYFFLGRTFFYQTIAIAREIKARHPEAEFSGMVAARSNLLPEMENLRDPKFRSYDWLSALEKEWLATPLDRKKLADYEKKLGTDTLKRLVISDREIGVGFINGAKVERTELMKTTQSSDDARWSYIVGILDYLFATFEREKPAMTFCYCVAATTELAIAEVSKYLGIPFCQPMHSRIAGKYILDDNIYNRLTPVKNTLAKLKKQPNLLDEFLPEAKKYLEDFKKRPAVPDYSVEINKKVQDYSEIAGTLRTLLIDAARWAAITAGIMGTKGVLRQRNGFDILRDNLRKSHCMKKTLRNNWIFESMDVIGDSEFIYYPLHVDPEASTMVFAPYHTDQIAVIESIAKQMPAGMKLIVKEHIPMVGLRPKGYYERIKAMPDVHLVSPFTDNFTLIKNSAVTCVITGTAALEAVMLGKVPVLMEKLCFDNIGEGFIHCPELTKLGEAIIDAMKAKPAREEKIINHIAAVMKEGFEMPATFWDDDSYSDPEVARIFVDKMVEQANNMKKKKLQVAA